MPMYKKSLLVLLVLALVVCGGAYYGMSSEDEAVVLDTASRPEAETKQASIMVYVTGAVYRPGMVELKEGARAADAVEACDGFLPQADSENVNLAQTLKDGQQLKIPARRDGAEPPQQGAKGKNGAAGGETALVNINTADEKELDSLPGVGPSTAQKIIEYREQEGAFTAPEDIMKVRGIGKGKYEKLKDRITT